MKLTTVFVTLSALIAGAALTEAAAVARAGPWSTIHHKKDIKHYRIYAENSGADLRHAKPVYDKCAYTSHEGKAGNYKYFAQTNLFEFQKLGHKTLGINCPDCTPQQLGNLYQTKLALNCGVKDHRSADWKPKGGN